MEKLIPSIVGYLIGFLVSTIIWCKTEGGVGLIPNLRITLGAKELVLHHWMLFLTLIIIVLILRNHISNKLFYLFLGIFIGGFHQGLTYKDWYFFLK